MVHPHAIYAHQAATMTRRCFADVVVGVYKISLSSFKLPKLHSNKQVAAVMLECNYTAISKTCERAVEGFAKGPVK